MISITGAPLTFADGASIAQVPLTTSQIDRLGERLKAAAEAGAPASDDDRRLLQEVRAAFLPAYEEVVTRIRELVGVAPSGRPEKTPESIVAKLQREGTKLSRMQDVAGCRVLVPDRQRQDELVSRLGELFSEHRLVDRREDPRHGYRAVHLIVRAQGRPIEVQVRTYLQETWAAFVEAWDDEPGIDLKHGVVPAGMERLRDEVLRASEIVALMERTLSAVPDGMGPEAGRLYLAGTFRGIMMASLAFDHGYVSVLGSQSRSEPVPPDL